MAIRGTRGNYSINGLPGSTQCSYSSFSNVLTFTNPNYTLSNYKYNQFFNTYEMFDSPGMRFNLSMKATFNSAANVQFYFKVLASTTVNISDFGQATSISSTQAIIYESSTNPETIYGLNQQEYQAVNAASRAYCPSFTPLESPTNTNTNSNNNTSNNNAIINSTNSTSNLNNTSSNNINSTNSNNDSSSNTANNSQSTPNNSAPGFSDINSVVFNSSFTVSSSSSLIFVLALLLIFLIVIKVRK